MALTLESIVTCCISRQSANAEAPIEVVEFGISTDGKPLQPENAEEPIVVTELGMVTVVIFEFYTKLLGNISTPSPIVTEEMFVFGISPIEAQFFAFQTNS